jgi:hypothetical protein
MIFAVLIPMFADEGMTWPEDSLAKNDDTSPNRQHTLHQNWMAIVADEAMVEKFTAAHGRLVEAIDDHGATGKFLVRQMLQEGWRCPKNGCEGLCLPNVAWTTDPGTGGSSDREIYLVDTFSHFKVKIPEGICDTCCEPAYPHALDGLCWPSTPVRETVWFTIQLLGIYSTIQDKSPVACDAFCLSINELHKNYATSPAESDIKATTLWRHYNVSVMYYRTLQRLVSSFHQFGVAPIGAGFNRCPSCFADCHSVHADACLGMTRYKQSARASISLPPRTLMNPELKHLFIDDNDVNQLKKEKDSESRTQKKEPGVGCPSSRHKAAQALGSSRALSLDIFGLGAVTCRHAYPVLLFNLKTEESPRYYALVLQRLADIFRNGSLKFFYVDIACIVDKHIRRRSITGLPPVKLVIGAFHAAAHVPECQKEFSQRTIAGAGLSYGDNVEHFWSWIRRLTGRFRYMSPFTRQDAITFLVDSRDQCRTLYGFAEYFSKLVKNTVKVEQTLDARLKTIAELAGCPHETTDVSACLSWLVDRFKCSEDDGPWEARLPKAVSWLFVFQTTL